MTKPQRKVVMAGSYPACDLTSAVVKSRATKNRLREVLGELEGGRADPAFKSIPEDRLFRVVASKIRDYYQVDK